ncbi:hypothetical protein [Nocardia suismassiliense]|uniref:hypothetical protein n=1 Tax=Nocardia suismassiliense TaxID=2077092 RepID=UPI0018FE77DC|nr:hypothetical protein [Nocardia suismassiliense]
MADGQPTAGTTNHRTEAHPSAQQTMTPFDNIYDQPDPRAYFRVLGEFDYQTPQHAQRIFRRLVDTYPATTGLAGPIAVLDICCSYGINAALLNHDLTLNDLYAHYVSPAVTTLTTAQLIEYDRAFYAAHRRPDPVPVIGLDAARNAIDYATAVGLLDAGFAENLETAPPSQDFRRAARQARLITITGGASFLSPRTFQPILTGIDAPAWVAAFVLRTGSYQPIADGLARHELITETAASTFPQRRFTSTEERQYAIEGVTAMGAEPRGKETAGYFHTALHLSRPAADIAALPLSALSG